MIFIDDADCPPWHKKAGQKRIRACFNHSKTITSKTRSIFNNYMQGDYNCYLKLYIKYNKYSFLFPKIIVLFTKG